MKGRDDSTAAVIVIRDIMLVSDLKSVKFSHRNGPAERLRRPEKNARPLTKSTISDRHQ